jgi:hypothetical protein
MIDDVYVVVDVLVVVAAAAAAAASSPSFDSDSSHFLCWSVRFENFLLDIRNNRDNVVEDASDPLDSLLSSSHNFENLPMTTAIIISPDDEQESFYLL